jgi:hypothetical protein
MASSSSEVNVVNVDAWAAHPEQLAQLLGRAPTGQVIADPGASGPTPNRASTRRTRWLCSTAPSVACS